jgi:ATP-dependent helicase/nuclease subunit A
VWMENGAFNREEAKAEKENWDDFRTNIAAPLLRTWRVHRYTPLMQVLFAAREVYDRMRHERGWLNFQDLLMRAAALLRSKPHVRRYFNQRFTYILVDEFQDTDPIQAEVMLLLTAADPDEPDWHRCIPRPGSLFVVGDPKQSIYRFRRADIVTYNEVKEIIVGSGCGDGSKGGGLLVRLSANFRTTSTLIDWVNGVFQPEPGDAGEVPGPMLRFPAQETEASPAYVKLLPGRTDGNAGDLAGLRILYVDDDYSRIDDAVAWEADLISRTIRHALDQGVTITRTAQELERGVPETASPRDFMIITRNRKHLSLYARMLQAYGIPHRVTGGAALNEVEELKLLHSCLRAVVRPDDPVALVAVLRSELFGVSDAALYAFKQAGGRFSYRAAVPEGLEPEDAEAIADAFAHLGQAGRLLSHLPPLAALERISSDLGLPVLSATHPGGDVQAGSLAKALEVLRRLQSEVWTTSQLVEYLGTLVDQEETFDGISARSGEPPAVRVMNLHKVKGLEAPVVFLAAPAGEWDHGVELHIDRSGPRILGYMGIRGETGSFGSAPLLACPAGWDDASELEKHFLDAEALRLRYVAATRAGSALIVTQRTSDGKNRRNPWKYFLTHLSCKPELPDPGKQEAPVIQRVSLSLQEVEEARDGILERLAHSQTPTYDARAAKKYALAHPLEDPAAQPVEVAATTMVTSEGEHGVEWGTVIHLLLEAAAREPGADLEKLAAAALPESGLDAGLAPAAAELVRGVLDSPIWQRSLQAERRLSEVPFYYLLDEDNDGPPVPVLLRGSIDLAFREDSGWVLVDYKTDIVNAGNEAALVHRYAPQLRLYARAWEACTGEPIKEMLLYFVRGGSNPLLIG